MIFLCYPRCSTCAKAQKWLEQNHIAYTYRDIAQHPPAVDELKQWVRRSGLPLKRFFNTSGLAYRALGLKDKLADMGEGEQLALLATDGMLVKRPLVAGDGFVLVGFRPQEWEEVFL